MKLFFKLILVFSFNAKAGVQSLDQAQVKKHSKGAEIRFLANKTHHAKNAFVGQLTVPAGGKVPLHQDETEEYIYVLSGAGTIWIDGQKHSIKKEDLVYMPAKAKVRFENGKKPLKALQIFAGPGPEKKYQSKAWK